MKKVILVVDMLNDFIDEAGVLSLKENGYPIVPVIKQKLEEYRKNGDIIVYLNDNHYQFDTEFERFPTHAVDGTWGAKVIDELTPQEYDFIISKKRYSGFYGTILEQLLLDQKPDLVEVVGCCTSICVAQTIADLANRDYSIMVDSNAVADFNQEAHDFYMEYQLPKIFGVIVE